jgi:hypothetical protein
MNAVKRQRHGAPSKLLHLFSSHTMDCNFPLPGRANKRGRPSSGPGDARAEAAVSAHDWGCRVHDSVRLQWLEECLLTVGRRDNLAGPAT